MNTNTTQKEIDSLFGKYKIPALTKNLPMKNLQIWSSKVAQHFGLDPENFRQVVVELFWSMAHVQLSLGYALIAIQECDFPNGIQGITLHEKNIPDVKMPEIYFWYYACNSHECIYRCWERINNVIKHVCFPDMPVEQFRKTYFPTAISDLQKDPKYNKNPYLKELQEQVEHRKNAADDRNEISHGKSSPLRNMNIEGKTSEILSADGLPFIYLDYSAKSPKKEIERIVDKYRKLLPAIKAMKEFIDNIDS